MTDLPPLLPRISDYIAWHARTRPGAPALVLGGQTLSYAQLEGQIDRLAAGLLAAGVQKGDRVATLATPHPTFVVAFLAAASIGAIWLGLNPRYQREELRRAADDAEPSILLAFSRIETRDYSADIAALRESCSALRRIVLYDNGSVAGAETLEEFLRHGDHVDRATLAQARETCGGRDPCLIVYTSGSTGAPKGALLHHHGIARFSLDQNRLWPVSPYRSLNYFPINHVGCVIDCTMPCLAAGGTLVFLEHFDAARSMELMVREEITVWGSVPSVFHLQLTLPDFDQYDLSAVQLVVWGGAAAPPPLIERLRRICPRLATNYGMTETTSAITVVEPTDDIEVLSGSVGTPFPGVEVRLAGGDGRPVAAGEEGEVQARSDLNCLGYWRGPEATAEAFTPDGFFRTGDLAVQRPDGRYRLVGRLKEMFKSGGYNVYPREIEEVLEAHPAVAVAAVVSAPDPVWQEVGVAYVCPKGAVTAAELEAFCRGRLANYKTPKRFVIARELPLLPIGKVDKKQLKARAVAEAERQK